MAAADHAEPDGDLYQLLGVPREASREEIAQAWRRRAGMSTPTPGPTTLTRRARSAPWPGPGRCSATRLVAPPMIAPLPAGGRAAAPTVAGRRPAWPDVVAPWSADPEPPLRAGPVRVEGFPHGASGDGWPGWT